MYLHVDGDKATVLQDIPHHGKRKHYFEEVLSRIEDEFDGWCTYKHLHEKHPNESAYLTAKHQEFSHLMLAIHDLVKCLQNHEEMHLSDTEKAEVMKLVSAIR